VSPDSLRNRILYFRVTLICLAFALVVVAGTYYYVQRTSDRLEANRAYSDAQFSDALRISSSQFAYSINKSVCGFRGFVEPTLKSYKAAADDKTLTASARARNDLRIRTTQAFLDSQVTVPRDFDCRNLSPRPPKP
jgi:hypothetical protein